MDETDLVLKLSKKLEQLKRVRDNWNTLWDNTVKYTLPIKGDFTSNRTDGIEINDHVYDSTATTACEMLAAGLHGMLTNPSIDWFAFKIENAQKDKKLSQWLEDIKDKVSEAINAPSAGFATNIHEVYTDLAVLGTACLYLTWVKDVGLQFQAIPLQQLYIDEDYKGHVDTVYRELCWSLSNIKAVFGEDAVDNVLQNYNKDEDKKYKVIHTVTKLKQPLKDGKSYHSIFWLAEEKKVISESYFYEMPYFVVRWNKASNETYGRSPSINSLPDIRLLQELTKETIISVQLANRPPLLVPNDDSHNPIDIYPNALIRYRNGQAPQPLNLATRPDVAFNYMQDLRNRIRAAYYVDQFAFGATPNMTATQVVEQVNTRNRLLLPILARIECELLGPLVERSFNLLYRQGMIGDIPVEQATDKEIKVEYVGALAISQKTSQLDRYLSMIQYISPFLQLNPQSANMLDTESALRDIAESYNLGFVVKDSEIIEEEKNKEEQSLQEQQSLQNELMAQDINNKSLQNQSIQQQLNKF